MNNKIYYSQECIDKIEILAKGLSDSINDSVYLGQLNTYLNSLRQETRLKGLLSNSIIYNRIRQKDASILEIGSGIGSSALITYALTNRKVYGVEPASGSYAPLLDCINAFKACNEHLPYTLLIGGGENIDLPNDSIDFIYSFEVMEHVQDPQRCLEEIYRILKKGGCAYIATCNYDSFYEGHYRKFWNPFIGKEGNRKRYERKGLSRDFLDELNFITKKKLVKWCNEIGFENIIYNPPFGEKFEDYKFEQIYPEDYVLPVVSASNPTWLHKKIESKMVNDFLKRLNREYKLYMLLIK